MPLALAAGAKTRSPISATAMTSPLLTAFPSRVSEPAEAVVVMVTDWKESLSGSEKPKSEASKVCEASSRMVMVLSVPAGASFAG